MLEKELDPICFYCPSNKTPYPTHLPGPLKGFRAASGATGRGVHSRTTGSSRGEGANPSFKKAGGRGGSTHRLQDGQPRHGPELTVGVRRQVQKAELQQKRQIDIARVFSVSSQG